MTNQLASLTCIRIDCISIGRELKKGIRTFLCSIFLFVYRHRSASPVKLAVICLTPSDSNAPIGLHRNHDSKLSHAWRSPELSMAAKQQTTRRWWDERREHFDLFISDAVLLEASGGDLIAANRRIEVLDKIRVLRPRPEADEIALALVERLDLPDRALADAALMTICIVHGIDYLLTWICTHIANATYQPIIHGVCDTFGFAMPVICTPDQPYGR